MFVHLYYMFAHRYCMFVHVYCMFVHGYYMFAYAFSEKKPPFVHKGGKPHRFSGELNARLFGTRLPRAALVFPQFFEFIHQRVGTGYAPLLKPLGFTIK